MLVRWLVNLKTYHKISYQPILVSLLLGLFASGCQEQKVVQCEQIFQIARSVTQSSKDISYVNSKQPEEKQGWLKAASRLTLAADGISALKINQSQLIYYQNQLATVYHIYSQATYDAVRARENKNLEALNHARTTAIKAGVIQQNLIQEINNYCLER
jgi:hypothetical protein